MSNIKQGSICLAILCMLFISSYVLFGHLNVKRRSPLPAISEMERLFKALANLGPFQVAGVEIMYDGKYSMKTENFSFSYTIQYQSLQKHRDTLAMGNRIVKAKQPVKWKGYLKVLAVGEELSKAISNFLTLAYVMAPGMGQMKLVEPHFRGGGMGAIGDPFEMFFNLKHVNEVLSNNGYSILVKDDEYEKECKDEMIYVLHHVYPNSRIRGPLTVDVYHELFEKKGGRDWMECDKAAPKTANKLTNGTFKKSICMRKFNMTRLQETVLKNAKCIEMARWVDHGLTKVNMGDDRVSTDLIFRWLIHPSDMLMEEAKAFMDLRLERPYVAIHIRSGHINRQPSNVRRCFKVAMEFVKALKSTRNVKSVFLSTDMTEFGSVARKRDITEGELAALAGAVTYDPKATGKLKVIVKSTVSMTSVLLMSQSDHLITLGTGSFHGFIVGRFYMHHLDMDPNTWSLNNICSKVRR